MDNLAVITPTATVAYERVLVYLPALTLLHLQVVASGTTRKMSEDSNVI